jgi:hypothetical protein
MSADDLKKLNKNKKLIKKLARKCTLFFVISEAQLKAGLHGYMDQEIHVSDVSHGPNSTLDVKMLTLKSF